MQPHVKIYFRYLKTTKFIMVNRYVQVIANSNFVVPNDYPLSASQCGIDEDGRKFIYVKGIRWFTNLNQNNNDYLDLTNTYSPEKYPSYENYNAIEVSKVKDIPKDYYGFMGVPITFFGHS